MEQGTGSQKNIFVLGFDEQHEQDLKQIPDADRFRFHPLLRSEELVYQEEYAVESLLDKAREQLRDFDGPVDGIICHWDFPASMMAAVLCEEFKLPGPSLQAVFKCSHKYWSRLEQRKAAPDNTPDFCAINPFDEAAGRAITLDYPFWIKPVNSFGSALGFYIGDDKALEEALTTVRRKIRRMGDPFNRLLELVDLPPEVEGVDGNHMIAEALIGGVEIAPEGSVSRGTFTVHGMVDMVRDTRHQSFIGYEYPSRAPAGVQARAKDVAQKVLRQIGFDNGCFNMEFFWDEPNDALWIVEINPRISQSHSYQFEQVDGLSNHEVAIHVALGETADFPHGAGPYRCASKLFIRHYGQEDGVVKRVPDEQDLQRLHSLQPDTRIQIPVAPGQRLSSLKDQEAYSYVLAELQIAAKNRDELQDKYETAAAILPFEIVPADRAQGIPPS